MNPSTLPTAKENLSPQTCLNLPQGNSIFLILFFLIYLRTYNIIKKKKLKPFEKEQVQSFLPNVPFETEQVQGFLPNVI